jgi:hypothetical protein
VILLQYRDGEYWQQQHKIGEAETTTKGNDEIKVDNRGKGGIDVRFFEKTNKQTNNRFYELNRRLCSGN